MSEKRQEPEELEARERREARGEREERREPGQCEERAERADLEELGESGPDEPDEPSGPEEPSEPGGRSEDREKENREGQGDEERDAHEPRAHREPTRPHEHEHTPTHPGNGTVNDSPDDLSLDGLDPDELELRRLLHQAVQDIEPREGTLEHLQRAIPARRARRRQVAVGMAAAALFVGTAVPALVHVSRATGPDARPAIAGQASEAHGGTSQGRGPEQGGSSAGTPSGEATAGQGADRSEDGRKDGGETNAGGGPGAGAGSPSATAGSGTPVCTASQLGSATAGVEAPDPAGVVYGTFRITNVSAEGCTVPGPGTVTSLAQGAADGTRIGVVQHTYGGPAARLPAPSAETPGLLLQPGAAYEVKFAWVPSQTCPTTGGGTPGDGETGDPVVPDESPTPGAGDQEPATDGGDFGPTTQMLRADGPADGSVVVSYIPETGSPTVSTTLTNACVGTIYRTGVLSAS
ncbi:hypothetical protein QEP66_11880 [Streptomyces sp. LB8]|uniref:hypothetical protein n=1 Tax=Streptomyces sp. LB8 TaxID=3042509 RepID=UPI0026471E25|nr:hypothetical protein [Streptomyces sp. LB8]MDN5382783.1 hypothetical protein [Streptomyces sp. LB8]